MKWKKEKETNGFWNFFKFIFGEGYLTKFFWVFMRDI